MAKSKTKTTDQTSLQENTDPNSSQTNNNIEQH